MRVQKGFTLIELMIVTAIVAIIAALVAPVLVRSKVSGYQAEEIYAMKQIGVARGPYLADGSDAYSIPTLVNDGYLSKSILRSPRDPSPEGAAVVIMEQDHAAPIPNFADPFVIPDYPISYYDLGDFYEGRAPIEIQGLLESGHQNVGWAVDFLDLTITDYYHGPRYFWGQGRYRRLLLDGSVQTRSMENLFKCTLAQEEPPRQAGQVSRLAVFADFTSRDVDAIAADCSLDFSR